MAKRGREQQGLVLQAVVLPDNRDVEILRTCLHLCPFLKAAGTGTLGPDYSKRSGASKADSLIFHHLCHSLHRAEEGFAQGDLCRHLEGFTVHMEGRNRRRAMLRGPFF